MEEPNLLFGIYLIPAAFYIHPLAVYFSLLVFYEGAIEEFRNWELKFYLAFGTSLRHSPEFLSSLVSVADDGLT